MKNKIICFLFAFLICFSFSATAFGEEETPPTTSETETTASTSKTTQSTTEATTTTVTEATTTTPATTTAIPTTTTTTTTSRHTTGTTAVSTIIPSSITTITETTDTEALTDTEDTETLLVIDTDEGIVANTEFAFVTKEQLATSKELGTDIEICGKLNDNANYRWVIRAATITDTQNDINLTISDDSVESAKIDMILPQGSKKSIFNFTFSGDLPFSAEITVEGVDLPNGNYHLYYFNKATAQGEYNQDVTVQDGKLVFNISHCSIYFISDALISKQSSSGLDSYVKLIIEVAIAIVIAIILGIVVSRLRSKSSAPDIEEIEALESIDGYIPDDDERSEVEEIVLKVENSEDVFEGTYDDVLMFDDKDEPKTADYGYGYKPHIDEFYTGELAPEENSNHEVYVNPDAIENDLIMEETDAEVYSENADLTGLAINEDE